MMIVNGISRLDVEFGKGSFMNQCGRRETRDERLLLARRHQPLARRDAPVDGRHDDSDDRLLLRHDGDFWHHFELHHTLHHVC